MAPPRRQGFTLLETLAALAVASVLLSFLFQIFLTQQRTYDLQQQLSDAQQSARVVTDEMTRALLSLGARVETERGQRCLLVAHPHQVVFSADLRADYSAMPPGAPVPGALPADPCGVFPAGTYTAGAAAETYRFTLDRNGDNVVDGSDRTQGEHYTLYRGINGGALQEVASSVANPRLAEPLFRYWGDFDGDGTLERLERVDKTTSSRVAAGTPLDALVEKIEVNLVTETVVPDPRCPLNGGYRQVRLPTLVHPDNLDP